MQQFKHPDELHQWSTGQRMAGERLALVPTMGNLHDGHLALVQAAREQASQVVVSIFVNPLQFGPTEDLAAYPRTLSRDRERLAAAGCDALFAPAAETMYPRGEAAHTRVEVPGLSEVLCGASRPGHFVGVATVVCKLLNMVRPDVALFGEKDYQQLLVIRRMVDDLALSVEILGVPTVRDPDGLAMSSRNGYLDADERARAPLLYATLRSLAAELNRGAPIAELERGARAQLVEEGFRPDYVSVRRATDLAEPRETDTDLIILAAARLGLVRLIDNLRVTR